MQHYSEQAWVDFLHGTGSSNIRTAMQAHLASGCTSCAAAVQLWKQVQTIATRETTYSPPEDLVRMVKLEFAAIHSQDDAKPVTARLMFDTFTHPAFAGVRSLAAAARQVIYEADGLTVDLRFDGPPRSTEVHLIGQALGKRTPRAYLGDASVTLWTEKGLPLSATGTNGFGEFNLEFEAQDHLSLSIQVTGRASVRIPLPNFGPKQDADGITEGTDAGYC